MKEEKHIYISEDASYPSLDTLSRYLNGDLPEEEMGKIEEALEGDPFMADVLEGLSESTDIVAVKQSVNRIKLNSQKRLFAQPKKREKLSKRQSRVAPNKYTQLIMATAAAIALLFTTVFVIDELKFDNSPKEQIATNQIDNHESSQNLDSQDPDANFIPPLDSVSNEEKNEDESFIAMNEALDNQTNNLRTTTSIPEEVNEAILNEGAYSDDDIMDEETESVLTKPQVSPKPVIVEAERRQEAVNDARALLEEKRRKEEEALKAERELSERSKILMDTAEYMSADEVEAIPMQKESTALIPLDERLRQNMNKNQAGKDKKAARANYETPEDAPLMTEEDIRKGEYLKGMAMADLLTEAIRLYDEGSFQPALNNVLEVLQSQPDNLVAKYYAGGCYFSIRQYKIAIPYLKEVVKIPNTDFQDDARWLLARSYAARGKEKNAIAELNILVEKKSEYAEEAAQLIDELKR